MDEPKEGFERPNHTQTPNSFFDESLKNISSLPELKVMLAIIRKTLGWQKTKDRISMSQIERLTGLGHQSVQRGIDLALEHGFIEREQSGQSFFYNLKLVTLRDQSPDVTSNATRPEPVTRGDRKPVTPRDTQKKPLKEKKEKSAHAQLMAFHAKHVLGDLPNPGAQGKAVKWLLEHYTQEQCEKTYDEIRAEAWRTTPVTWLTVRSEIGDRLKRASEPRVGYTENGQKILTDDGERYTVMGDDGTPSKRWRTPEAFAQDTGRDVEEVRATWN